ncbi:glutamate synthase subunit beta [Candidatus Neomarinimicrobiota bacterium]
MVKDETQFLKTGRKNMPYRAVEERLRDWNEVTILADEQHSREQAARCMDCGTPFCQQGCPVMNIIPEWNEAVFHKRWDEAFALLNATNNLPEITGRICPAPCEDFCVLGIHDDPVTIRENELAIIEYGFEKGYLKPVIPESRTGKSVAVVGSGPAGLACAAQLNQAGHKVIVYERDPRVGGLLRYGIPDFKLEKHIIDRRIAIWEAEGIEFRTGINVGVDLPVPELLAGHDAVCITIGARQPRDLPLEGRDLKGIHFAMDYLTQANRRIAGELIPGEALIEVAGKNVVIIGGGDTGSDCLGTTHRQNPRSVKQIEVLPKPPDKRTSDTPWPGVPVILRESTSHHEGGERMWSINTRRFSGNHGRLEKLSCVEVEFKPPEGNGRMTMTEIPGTEFDLEADVAILAIGFLHPMHQGLIEDMGVALDERGNIKVDSTYMSSVEGVFSAGDARRGQSLIVWAIHEGRQAAAGIHKYLMTPSS